MKILHIEDCIITATLFRKLMEGNGHSVCHRENGEIGLSVYKNYLKRKNKNIKFDMIVSDYQMPKMNGDKFVEEIRKIDKEIFIIANSSEESLSNLMLQKGADIIASKESIRNHDFNEWNEIFNIIKKD